MRARLLALLTRNGTTPTGLARSMGRAHTWLLRKVNGARPLHLDDLDEVLEHLGADPAVLLGPVLLEGDGLVLRSCYTPGRTLTPERLHDLVRVQGGTLTIEQLDRLRDQGLIDTDDDGQLYTTTAGVLAASRDY